MTGRFEPHGDPWVSCVGSSPFSLPHVDEVRKRLILTVERPLRLAILERR